MLRRTLLFCVASAVGLSGCAEGAATPDVKTPASPQTGPASAAQNQSDSRPEANAKAGTGTTAAADAASTRKAGTTPTTQDLVKFVLGIQGKLGKLSELENALGLDFQYNADRASAEIQVKDGAQDVTISLLLEPAPRVVVGNWGKSEPDRNFDPRVTMFRIESKADMAPPVSKEGKEILRPLPHKREVWAWGRFFYYYPKQNAEWILEWQKSRDDFHYSPADVTKIREVLTAVAKAMGQPDFSFSSYFSKNHAAAAVQGSSDLFDFRGGEVFVEEKTMEVDFLNETQIDGFFRALGIPTITFAFKSDVGHKPVPVQAKGCEVTVSRGTWPDDDKRSGADKSGPTSTLRVKAMSVNCGG